MDLENIFSIARTIALNGGRLYLVGGAVRDEIMGLIPSDFDFCVTGLAEEKFMQLFPVAKKAGKYFPVFYIKKYEFALARSERKVSEGHKGFEFNVSDKITINEDLKRRDFTINAIAKDVLTGVFVDPFGGAKDIANKTIRHISNAFLEDPLRVYRAARFAATFNFNIAEETLEIMKNIKQELNTLSKERVFKELYKALGTDTPSIFFNILKNTNTLDVHFKELYNLIDIPQNIEYHPEGDVYNHTMLVLDRVSKATKDESLRYCALVHDFGKALTPKNVLPKHTGHDKAGINIVKDFSDYITAPKIWKQKAMTTVKYHMLAKECDKLSPITFAKFINAINRSKLTLDELETIVNCNTMIKNQNISFANLGNKMLSTVTGKKLIEQGITPETVGIEKFKNLLIQRQAKFITEERKLAKF